MKGRRGQCTRCTWPSPARSLTQELNWSSIAAPAAARSRRSRRSLPHLASGGRPRAARRRARRGAAVPQRCRLALHRGKWCIFRSSCRVLEAYKHPAHPYPTQILCRTPALACSAAWPQAAHQACTPAVAAAAPGQARYRPCTGTYTPKHEQTGRSPNPPTYPPTG